MKMGELKSNKVNNKSLKNSCCVCAVVFCEILQKKNTTHKKYFVRRPFHVQKYWLKPEIRLLSPTTCFCNSFPLDILVSSEGQINTQENASTDIT